MEMKSCVCPEAAHNINWQEARILSRENNWGRRRVLEALEDPR